MRILSDTSLGNPRCTAKADGSFIEEVIFPMEAPNGIGLSPDEDELYVGEGRSGDHPKGASASAHPRCWRLSTYARYAFEALPSGLDACGRADPTFEG